MSLPSFPSLSDDALLELRFGCARMTLESAHGP